MAGRWISRSASSLCRASDDLTYDFPQRADRPSIQAWDTTADRNNATHAVGPQMDGRLLVDCHGRADHKCSARRHGRQSRRIAYDVSVVVFYKRLLPDAFADHCAIRSGMTPQAPNAPSGSLISTGLNGGELLLTQLRMTDYRPSPFDNLKIGQWIMLCGPHPNSSTIREPRFRLELVSGSIDRQNGCWADKLRP